MSLFKRDDERIVSITPAQPGYVVVYCNRRSGDLLDETVIAWCLVEGPMLDEETPPHRRVVPLTNRAGRAISCSDDDASDSVIWDMVLVDPNHVHNVIRREAQDDFFLGIVGIVPRVT